MLGLLDVNVLVALAWPTHVHHHAAHEWFARNQSAGWATCPITQSGFVRVSSNGNVVSDARTPREALEILRRLVALPRHRFLPDDTSLATSQFVSATKLVGYRQVTDVHLLALALRHGARLVTFDAGVRSLVQKERDPARVVCLIGSHPIA